MADVEEYFPRGGKKPTTTYFKQSENVSNLKHRDIYELKHHGIIFYGLVPRSCRER